MTQYVPWAQIPTYRAEILIPLAFGRSGLAWSDWGLQAYPSSSKQPHVFTVVCWEMLLSMCAYCAKIGKP